MQSEAPAPNPKWMTWIGWIISVLVAAMLIMSGVMKFMEPTPEVVEGFNHLGWDLKLALALGILEVSCTVIYLFPRTAVLGAILVTGYMGGAIATHVRVGDLFVVQALIGVAAWLGVYLREPRLRAVLPWRT